MIIFFVCKLNKFCKKRNKTVVLLLMCDMYIINLRHDVLLIDDEI